MAIAASKVTVGNTDTVILAAGSTAGASFGSARGRGHLIIRNPLGGQTVFVGGVGVTTAAGYPLAGGEVLEFEDLGESDTVHGIVASSTQDVNIIYED